MSPHINSQAIHYADISTSGEQIVIALCGEKVLFTNVSRLGRDVNCPTCLGLMALNDALSILDAQEAKALQAIRNCKLGGDMAVMIRWQDGHVKIDRVLRSK